MSEQPNPIEEDDNPFAGMPSNTASHKPPPMSKREITRKVIAGLVLIFGAVVIGVGFLLSIVSDRGYFSRLGFFVGLAIFGVAFALYEGTLFGSRRRPRS